MASKLLSPLVGGRVFKIGDSGSTVADIQIALRDLGFPLKGTGYYGTATDAAVTAFQKRAFLLPDGRVGPKTATAIDIAVRAPRSVPSVTAPQVRAEFVRPLWLQIGLDLLGTKETPGGADNKAIMAWAEEEGGDIAATYTHDVIPWCALFENHILTKAGLKGTETLWALDFNAQRMQRRLGRSWPAVALPGPAVGAIAPMLRNGGGHVITIAGRDQFGNVMGLGGNQSDTVSVIPFPLSRLNEGYWWPEGVALPALIGLDRLPLVLSDGRLSSKEA